MAEGRLNKRCPFTTACAVVGQQRFFAIVKRDRPVAPKAPRKRPLLFSVIRMLAIIEIGEPPVASAPEGFASRIASSIERAHPRFMGVVGFRPITMERETALHPVQQVDAAHVSFAAL